MKILFSNDDGYDAIGINTVYHEFSPHHDVRMCAPLNHKSAFSHAITYQDNLEILKLRDVNGFALDGTPADCAKIGINHLFPEVKPFDLIISGINFGVNIGRDVFYSGTVGATREATFFDLCGVALSQQVLDDDLERNSKFFKVSASYARQIIEAMPKELFKIKDLIYNINFPATTQAKGVKITTLSRQTFDMNITETEKKGTKYVSYAGTKSLHPDDPTSDATWLYQGYIVISALYNGAIINKEVQEKLLFLEKLQLKH
ncbi:MAG: 5'/3'-nucleotidase SurE [Brevinema sp.]